MYVCRGPGERSKVRERGPGRSPAANGFLTIVIRLKTRLVTDSLLPCWCSAGWAGGVRSDMKHGWVALR